jgi:hypothetical protein
VVGHEALDPALEDPCLGRQPVESPEAVAGELGLDAPQPAQELRGAPPVDLGGEVRDGRAVSGNEDHEIGVQAVASAGRLGDEILARLDQELQLAAGISKADGRQLGLAARHPGDREGVARVALAGSARPGPFAMAELGRHLDRGLAGREQVPGRAGAVPGRALETDPLDPADLVQPGEQRAAKPAGSLAKVRSPSTTPTSSMAHAASVALWVSIPTTRIVSPFPRFGPMGVGQVRQMCVEVEVTLL